MLDDHPRMGWMKNYTWVNISRKKFPHNVGLVGLLCKTGNPYNKP
jgi:hypothetical protein